MLSQHNCLHSRSDEVDMLMTDLERTNQRHAVSEKELDTLRIQLASATQALQQAEQMQKAPSVVGLASKCISMVKTQAGVSSRVRAYFGFLKKKFKRYVKIQSCFLLSFIRCLLPT